MIVKVGTMVLKYFENKYKKPIYESFTHLCLINTSSFGPIYEDGKSRHWLDPFFDKIVETNSIACSPYINTLSSMTDGTGRTLIPIFTLFKISKKLMKLLMNNILGKKEDKTDSALTGESVLSRILLNNNYIIFYIRWEILYNSSIKSLKQTIFIKNNWRSGELYTSPLILYNYCIKFLNKKLNIKDFEYNSFDYSLFKPLYNEGGIVPYNLNIKLEDWKWSTPNEFYDRYGYSEEYIIFSKI